VAGGGKIFKNSVRYLCSFYSTSFVIDYSHRKLLPIW
jgi:hypothetical protein